MNENELRNEITSTLDLLQVAAEIDPFTKITIPQEISDRLWILITELNKLEGKYKDVIADSSVYLRLAVFCSIIGKFDIAVNFAEKALKTQNKLDNVKFIQGFAYFKAGVFKKAIGYFDEVLAQNPMNWQAWFFKGESLHQRSLHDRAVEAYLKAIGLKKDKSDLWIALGNTLVDLGKTDDASKAFLEGARLGDNEGKNNKIREMMEDAKLKRIPKLFENILKLVPNAIEVYLALGAIYKENGDYKKAMEFYAKGSKLQPTNTVARKGYDESLEAWKKKYECKICKGSGKCKDCDGDGICISCKGSGKCPLCKGSKDCIDCDGTGKCSNCHGKGKIKLLKKCPVCLGTGKCTTCHGKKVCTKCKGSGKCSKCEGSRECKTCTGLGKCIECEGKGYREPAGT